MRRLDALPGMQGGRGALRANVCLMIRISYLGQWPCSLVRYFSPLPTRFLSTHMSR